VIDRRAESPAAAAKITRAELPAAAAKERASILLPQIQPPHMLRTSQRPDMIATASIIH